MTTLPARSVGAAERLDHAIDQPPEHPGERQQQDREQDNSRHGLPDVEPVFPWADAIPSRARRAACPSGLSGASSTTFCHSVAAAFRSCLPNASTMPLLSSVFVCAGLIASDRSNCARASSGLLL